MFFHWFPNLNLLLGSYQFLFVELCLCFQPECLWGMLLIEIHLIMNLFCPVPPCVVCLGWIVLWNPFPSGMFVWSTVIKHILSKMRSLTPNSYPCGGLVFILRSTTFWFLSLIFHEHISIFLFVCLFVLSIHDYGGPLFRPRYCFI